MSIPSDNQTFHPGKIVEMYMLDATDQGVSSIIYFTAGTVSGVSTVVHNGITYSPLDVMIEGMEYTTEGNLPEPTITIGNVSKTVQAEVIAHSDLLGAKLTRRRTYEKYLDGQPQADPTAIFNDDVYYFERKTAHNKRIIQWSLNSIIDYEGKQLPDQVMLKDTCIWRYRIWDTTASGFDYTDATCPFTAASYFDATGTVCGASDDVCGHRLSDCELRYPNSSDTIPFGGYPGISKVRV